MKEFLDMSKASFKGKTVLLRVDINSPIDPATGEFMDMRRMHGSTETIDFLARKGAKVVVLAHQGRPGDEYEFTKLDTHAEKLSKLIGRKVHYLDSLFGSYAQRRIKQMKNGEILLLENVRFYAEENLSRPADAQVKTHLVRNLTPHADYYVNDAFAAAHRSQPSLVGFAETLPSFPGKNMVRELEVLTRVSKASKKQSVFLLGGAKTKDSLKVIDKALTNKAADVILTTGIVSLAFLAAKGYDLGDPTQEFLKGKGVEAHIPYAKELMAKFGDKIQLPFDVALDHHGKRMEVSVGELPMPYMISDIGSGTIGRYSYILSQADIILANGPAGYFEEPEFAKGTHQLLEAVAKCRGFTVIGGGHLAVAAETLNLREKIDHISTAGGACILFLAGESLPVLEALKRSKLKFKGKKSSPRRKK